MTIRAALQHGLAQLEAAGITSARLDAELLLAQTLGHDRAWLLSHDQDPLPPLLATRFHHLINRRVHRIPLVHLTGTREFYGLDFAITPAVLTPRVETETMVDWAIQAAPPHSRLIDIGTGSGALAIAIAVHRPDLAITATDLSEHELAIARRNAATHDVNIEFIASDLWSRIPGSFHTIVTNLPYLRDDAAAELMPEVQQEPAVALFGGPDGLNLYRRLLAGLPSHLLPNGRLFTECDPWQHEALITAARRHHLQPVQQNYFILGFEYQIPSEPATKKRPVTPDQPLGL